MNVALTLTSLPYVTDPIAVFARLRKRPGAVLLDSGRPDANGRYDIISSDPLATLSIGPTGEAAFNSRALPKPPDALHKAPFALQEWLLAQLDITMPENDLPFSGGLIGYWSYDLGRYTQQLDSQRPAPTSLPLARLGLYDWALVIDHLKQEVTLLASQARRTQVLQWLDAAAAPDGPFALTTAFRAQMTREGYSQRFAQVQRYIRSGDCYQINLAQRFSAHYEGDVWSAYLRLRRATPTPFSGFMAWQDKAVLSLSPERFIQAHRGNVETRPIKGTRPRGASREHDQQLAQQLLSSTKDRAENVMIVDLLRNDLGRVCQFGSIHVPQLCELESYPNVHHLVSVVRGQLDKANTPLALLEAASPGGSITGAPKIRAMQIIDELEPCQRSVYCGSLGYIDHTGSMDTSIAIRTVVADAGQLHLWGGGGLVADSEPDAEYDETLDKIRHLINALTST